MKINIYKIFKENGLVENFKEYNELVRLRCMYINDERIDTPSEYLEIEELKSIKAGLKKINIDHH